MKGAKKSSITTNNYDLNTKPDPHPYNGATLQIRVLITESSIAQTLTLLCSLEVYPKINPREPCAVGRSLVSFFSVPQIANLLGQFNGKEKETRTDGFYLQGDHTGNPHLALLIGS